jgi:hypothetical protein
VSVRVSVCVCVVYTTISGDTYGDKLEQVIAQQAIAGHSENEKNVSEIPKIEATFGPL